MYDTVVKQGFQISLLIVGNHGLCKHPENLFVTVVDKKTGMGIQHSLDHPDTNLVQDVIMKPNVTMTPEGSSCRLVLRAPPVPKESIWTDTSLQFTIRIEEAYATMIHYSISTMNVDDQWKVPSPTHVASLFVSLSCLRLMSLPPSLLPCLPCARSSPVKEKPLTMERITSTHDT